jgi:hypothetical protein
MRRLISKEEEAKKRKRNQWIIGGVLVLIMVVSTLGYAFIRDQFSGTTASQKIIYNGLEFDQNGNLWNTSAGNLQLSFSYNPQQTVKVNSILNPLGNYANKPLYIYSQDTLAATEIYRNLFYLNQIALRVQNACFAGENCSDNSPVKTCQDNLIIIKASNITEIKQQNNCVFIEGHAENLTSLSDSFLFKIIGIQ